ncbi:MAG: PDZ domain-containing protein, partial [Candidatus Fimimonas sp.]
TESVKITSVAKNSVLYGKLLEQDVILSVTVGEVTTQVTKNYLVSETLLNARAGDEVCFEVLRNGQTITVEVTLTSNDFCAY